MHVTGGGYMHVMSMRRKDDKWPRALAYVLRHQLHIHNIYHVCVCVRRLRIYMRVCVYIYRSPGDTSYKDVYTYVSMCACTSDTLGIHTGFSLGSFSL
jgi:hypothetical protein